MSELDDFLQDKEYETNEQVKDLFEPKFEVFWFDVWEK